MSVLYKVYDGLGNLVASTADFGLALDVGMACDLRDSHPRHGAPCKARWDIAL